jgi:hypothetical protein
MMKIKRKVFFYIPGVKWDKPAWIWDERAAPPQDEHCFENDSLKKG